MLGTGLSASFVFHLAMRNVSLLVHCSPLETFRTVLGSDWNGTTAQAIDIALLGRYYERFADHAVAVARRVIYLITGETPEGVDWPNA